MVGLGDVARAHMNAYARLENARVVAAADPSASARERLRDSGISLYESAEGMIAHSSLDAVVICTPPASHEHITETAASAGLHVLCEKPMALTVASAERMRATCDAAGVKFFYGSTNRYLPTLMRAKAMLESGALGHLIAFREEIVGGEGLEVYEPLPFSHYPKGGIGGNGWGLVDHGIHMIDILPWLAGAPIESVFGRGDISGNAHASEYAIMHVAGGNVTGHLLYLQSSFPTDLPMHGTFAQGSGWGNEGYSDRGVWDPRPACIHLYCSRASLRVHHYANELFLTDSDGVCRVAVAEPPPPIQFERQARAFVDCIVLDRPPPVPSSDGIQALRVLEALYESQATHKTVLIGNC